MRFTCSRCGKRYASTDEPVPGRIYAIGCKCGHTIVVKDAASSGGRNGPATAPRREDPFAPLHSPSKGGRVAPLRPPGAPGTSARHAPQPAPAPAPASHAPPSHAPAPPRPATAAARAFSPPPPPAARGPAQAPAPTAPDPPFPPPGPRGVAGRAPSPAERPYDAVAASHGILLDVDRARALSSGSMTTDSIPLPESSDDEEISITFSDRLPLFRPAERPRPWLLGAAVGLAALVVLWGAWALLGQGTSTSTVEGGPAAPRAAAPGTAAPAGAPPAAAGGPAASPAAAPANAPGAATPAPAATAASPVAPPRPPPGSAPPASQKAPAARPRGAPGAATSRSETAPGAPGPPPRSSRPRPPAPAPAPAVETPGRASEPGTEPAASPALLDLLSRKRDAPAAAAPRADDTSGAGPESGQVEAAVQRNRTAFDACMEELDAAGARLGARRVILTVTVNPSGILTSPRFDDPDLDGSAAGVCLKSAARKLVVPASPGDPVRVRVPITLGP